MRDSGSKTQLATFAGGCFWCMVKPFDNLPGVLSIVSGYTGGHTDNPTYEIVGTEITGHAEAVQIKFEPDIFSYKRLLEIFWRLIDPTDQDGQFMDRGASYRTAIFVHNKEQWMLAEASKIALQKSRRFKGTIVTPILPAMPFYPAEAVHQNYYNSNRYAYNRYYEGSGRASFMDRYWNRKQDIKELRGRLSDIQYSVTQEGVDEPIFDNLYWNNTSEGIYVDVINGDPLFCSLDQFDAGTGLPAFVKPLHDGFISKRADLSNGQIRTALYGRLSGSYLGHLYHDDTQKGGLHYQVNSASLRFISVDQLEHEGYDAYLQLFVH